MRNKMFIVAVAWNKGKILWLWLIITTCQYCSSTQASECKGHWDGTLEPLTGSSTLHNPYTPLLCPSFFSWWTYRTKYIDLKSRTVCCSKKWLFFYHNLYWTGVWKCLFEKPLGARPRMGTNIKPTHSSTFGIRPPPHLGGRWSSAICTMTPPLVPSSLFSLTNILIPESWDPWLYTSQTKLINKATKSFVYWTDKPQSCSPFWLPSKSHLWIKVWVWKPKASKKNVSITVSSLGQTRKSGWRGVEKKLSVSVTPTP